MTPSLITVLILDDHAVVRRGLRALFESQPDLQVVAEAGSGPEALELAASSLPDVAVVDLLLPGMGGVECTRRLREVSPRTEILVLTSHHRDEHLLPALQAGALSYLLKEAAPEEIVDALRATARGEARLHSRVAGRVIRELREPRRGRRDPSALTAREMEVLRRIADGHANRRIAADLGISEKTVKRHVSNILGKLHLADRTQAAVHAWRQGWVTSGS